MFCNTKTEIKHKCKQSEFIQAVDAPLIFVISNKQNIDKPKHKKYTPWIFFGVNILIVAAIFIYQFGFHETKPLSELFNQKPFYRYFFISLGIIVFYYVLSGFGYALLIKRTTGRFRLLLGIELAVVGKYWDNITPFGSGGQFAQVAFARKKNVSSELSTSVVVAKYMVNMAAFVIIGIIVLFIPIDTFTSGTIIKILAAIGVGINLFLTAFVWLVSVSKRMFAVVVVGGLKLLYKMHIVKNYNKALYKSLRFVKQYQKAFKYFVKNPIYLISEIFISFFEHISTAFIAYLIYLAFNPAGGVSPVTILAMSFLCSFAMSYIPIPGGSGMAEISFAVLFSKLFSESATFWALIFWRIFTYYLVIAIGFIFTISEPFVSNRLNKRKFKSE